ncbi:sensor histidine kinase [Salipaludibacillus daqingensis]|uniref:sensor histidine kinase n=1 Tax=Salipaludibacillus daqingensis TaxID=3041001 RepID=UPI002473E0DB|nr:sensor histidine kinase [Salipaludibacillus daqingensis]
MRIMERHQFWIWFTVLAVAWIMALQSLNEQFGVIPMRLIGTALFFLLFFLAPLFKDAPKKLVILLIGASILTTVTFSYEPNDHTILYVLLIYTILIGKAVFRLQRKEPIAVAAVGLTGALFLVYRVGDKSEYVFVILYALLLSSSLYLYKQTMLKERDAVRRNEALLSEYRKMKRQLISGEKAVREEERTEIAREIHDSVGHKLTALLMQLEVFRMKSSHEISGEVQELKQLAKDSLEETRSAVKKLKQDGKSGLPAVIQLIRKLEAESLIRIHFTMRHGALTAPLRNDQSIAVYRSVQEALTNMMKHSDSREVDILFEAPAGTVFRFEVSNQTNNDISLREGFGLKSMRERVEAAGGTLEIKTYTGRFVVRGTLPLTERMEERT